MEEERIPKMVPDG